MSADLHCHTTVSDGSVSPEFLVSLAKRVGLSAVAITDHDYYAGSYHAAELGVKHGITVIEGIECSTADKARGHRVHILCYRCKYTEVLDDLLAKANRSREEAVRQMIRKASRLYPITEEMVMDGVGANGFCGKQHIMLALMKAGYTDEMFGDLYRQLFSVKDGSCFVSVAYPDALEAMRCLRESGGVIVLAHPSVYGSIASLDDLIRAGLHGVELYHPRNTSEHQKMLLEAAAEHGLLLTGGTDFHGCFAEKSRLLPLGTCTASDEQFEVLMEKSARLWQEN